MCSCVFVLVVTIYLLYLVVLPGCRVHSAYVQLATLIKLLMSAILFLNALALQHVRQRYSHLFTDDDATMISFFWQRDMRDVVYFVLECLDVMTS